ncbi:MAG: gamma-glutamyl-gamma-aminobutyrate hydrolase family protein [Candidatus Dormibacteria bacterium]
MSQGKRGSAPLVLVPMRAGHRDEHETGDELPVQTVNSAYIEALQEARTIPVMIPLGEPLPVDLDWASGLLLPGGADVEPKRYGADPHPTSEWDPELDRLEFHLLEWALRAQVPILGVCRGLQVLNVGLGGTLVQDLPSQRPDGGEHPRQGPRDHLSHGLHVDPQSMLHEILGGSDFQVNSLHHQGIGRIASALRMSAWADDGLVEGVETTSGPWIAAVQFHPEELFRHHLFARRLFQAFAFACAGEAPQRPADLVGAASHS